MGCSASSATHFEPDGRLGTGRKSGSTRLRQLLVFYGGYFIFAGIGLPTSIASFVLAFFFRSPLAHHFGQRFIHYLFRFFAWYLTTFGLLRIETANLRTLKHRKNLILAANHPSLLDAVFIAAYLPNIFCLMKANLVHNLILCGQAKLAGYVNNKTGVGLIKTCHRRIRDGSNLLVFPEGTRSNRALSPFKMGFAVLAHAGNIPVQTLVIRYDINVLGKGWPFFSPPPFPVRCSIEAGPRFVPRPDSNARRLGQEVEEYFRRMPMGLRCAQT